MPARAGRAGDGHGERDTGVLRTVFGARPTGFSSSPSPSSSVSFGARNRPTGTTLTVPASAGSLAGSYTTGYGYDRGDRVVATDYPAVGGLPAETVTTAYNTVGLPETLIGAEDYVWSMTYDDRGRPSVASQSKRVARVVAKKGWEQSHPSSRTRAPHRRWCVRWRLDFR
jgi:hypothetical protein